MIRCCTEVERDWSRRHNNALYVPPSSNCQVIPVRKTFQNEDGVDTDYVGDAWVEQDLDGRVFFYVVYEDGDCEEVEFDELQELAMAYVSKAS